MCGNPTRKDRLLLKLHDHFPKVRLPLWATLLAAVLLAGAITLLALWCQPNALRSVLAVFRAQPLLIILNCLPVGMLLLVFTCLLRNVFFAGALANFAVCALSIANRIKIEVRDEPVFPRDFALLKEAGSAVGTYDIQFPVPSIAAVVVFSLVLVALGLFVGSRPFPIARLRGWVGSLLGAAASFVVLAGLILTVYASNDLYNSFRVSNAYYIPSVFNELGFPYCFCHQFTTYPVDKPEGFSRSEAAGWDQGGDTGLGKDVNVIMVMDEAFSDITDSDAFAFTAENDPLPNLHALREDPHAVAGHIVVPGFAGGTANTEFDVLTGMQTNALAAGTTSSFRVVNRNLDSLFRVFGGDGYHTSFFHPGDDWFYNRENVYRWFGAEETVFADQMEALAYKGRWVTDDYMAGLIEQEFADTVAAGETLFHYTTTIQNHMSYTLDKYGESYAYPEVPLNTAVSDEVETLLRVYTEGARDADAMLGRLVDTFSAVEEPVVLVFFGDHLPYLGDNQLAYAELGFTARPEWDALTSYETPYVIWANDAAAQALDWEAAVASLDLPEDGRLSASFLGAAVLELTGRTGESPWFDFLNQLRRELPVVQKQAYQLADGTVTDQLTEEQAARACRLGDALYVTEYQDSCLIEQEGKIYLISSHEQEKVICYRAEGGPKVFTVKAQETDVPVRFTPLEPDAENRAGSEAVGKAAGYCEYEVCIGDVPVDKLHQLYLEADYVGDRAELYLDGRLADDWFTNGETWHAALKRFDYPASLVLRIYSSDSPIPNPYDNQVYYDLPVEKGCALRGVKAVAEYKTEL